CVPDCTGSVCGDDGCGGTCGGCRDGLVCEAGQCFPDAQTEVTVGMVWEEVIEPRCITCHGSGEGGFVMGFTPQSFRAAVVGMASHCFQRVLVEAGDPDASYLVHKVEGRAGICGSRMPYARPALKAGELALLHRWIADGALAD